MFLRFVWIGKTRNEHLSALADDYLKRLRRFVRCEVAVLKESASPDAREGIAEEGKRIIGALRPDAVLVLLDVEGREWSSPEFAAQVERWQLESAKEVTFVVGGHHGVSEDVRGRASIQWSLSRLTLTHEMARVVLLEQVYRAYTILRGLPYQK